MNCLFKIISKTPRSGGKVNFEQWLEFDQNSPLDHIL